MKSPQNNESVQQNCRRDFTGNAIFVWLIWVWFIHAYKLMIVYDFSDDHGEKFYEFLHRDRGHLDFLNLDGFMSETKSTLDVIACKYLRQFLDMDVLLFASYRWYSDRWIENSLKYWLSIRLGWSAFHVWTMQAICPNWTKMEGTVALRASYLIIQILTMTRNYSFHMTLGSRLRMQKQKQLLVEKVQFQLLHHTIKLIGLLVGIILFKDALFLLTQNLKWL